MPEFLPFRGIRYDLATVGEASRVVAPPYDILSDEAVRSLYRRSPYNIIRVDLGKVRDDSGDIDADWHGRAGELFRSWRAQGVLVDEATPAYYALRQRYVLPGGETKELVGLIGCCHLTPFSQGEVLAHEHTFAKPKEDRLRLMRATEANISQIYAFYSDPEQRVRRVLAPLLQKAPAASVVDDEGQTHELWVVSDPRAIEEIRAVFAERPLFIADGHHRYETALAYKEERERLAGGRGGWSYVMMFAANLDEGGITVLPTHRLVTAAKAPLSVPALAAAVGSWYRVEAQQMEASEALAYARKCVDEESGRLGCYLGRGTWVWLTPVDRERITGAISGEMAPAVKRLTVTALHELVLPRAFAIDKEEQAAGGAIEYLRDADVGIDRVDQGRAAALIYVPAPGPEHILQVASAGDVMPHKSTYFYPKLLTGLVMNDLTREPGC